MEEENLTNTFYQHYFTKIVEDVKNMDEKSKSMNKADMKQKKL
jgi:hypothetical protein